jgi:hypothetical protein
MTSPNKNWTNWTWSLSFVVKKSYLKVKRGKQMVGRSPNHQKKKWKMENKVKKNWKKNFKHLEHPQRCSTKEGYGTVLLCSNYIPSWFANNMNRI